METLPSIVQFAAIYLLKFSTQKRFIEHRSDAADCEEKDEALNVKPCPCGEAKQRRRVQYAGTNTGSRNPMRDVTALTRSIFFLNDRLAAKTTSHKHRKINENVSHSSIYAFQ